MHLHRPAPSWPLRALTALALLILVAVAYHAAPENGFHFDDADNILRHGPVHMTDLSLDGLAHAATEGRLPRRMIPNMSFAIDWWRGGGDAYAFQITNLLIHAANTLATLAFLYLILQRAGIPAKVAWFSAAIGTAAWALHPIQVQAVTYVVQRMTGLASLFMLIAVWSYVKARLSGKPLRWLILTGVASTAAWFSKENAYILPLLILLAEYSLCRAEEPLIRNGLDRTLLATPFVVLAYLVLDLAFLDGPAWQYVAQTYAQRDFTLAERLLTQPRVIFFHLGQILAPIPGRFSIEHDIALSRSLIDPWTTPLALGGLVLWIFGGLWLLLRTRHRAPALLVLWAPITLSIESSFIPLEIIFEHRMYLPSVALAGGLAYGLATAYNYGWRKSVAVVSVVIISGLLGATLVRVPTWKTSITLYEHASQIAPNSPRIWTNLATAYEQENRSTDALRAYDRAIALDPDRAIAYLNRGSSHRRTGNIRAAEYDYRRFMELRPGDFRGPYALGKLLLSVGQYADAETLMLTAVQLNPKAAQPYEDLAQIQLATGQPEAALAALEQARQRDPAIADADYHESRGVSLARLGRFGEAANAFGSALALAPDRPDTHANLGFALLRSGQADRALRAFDNTLTLQPANARAHAGRAECLFALQRPADALRAVQDGLITNPDDERLRQLLTALSPPAQ